MQSSIIAHKNFELHCEFDKEPMKRNQNKCHMRPFGGEELSSSMLEYFTEPCESSQDGTREKRQVTFTSSL